MGGNNKVKGDNKRLFLLYLLQNQHGFLLFALILVAPYACQVLITADL